MLGSRILIIFIMYVDVWFGLHPCLYIMRSSEGKGSPETALLMCVLGIEP